MKSALILLPGMLADAAFWRSQTEALADRCDSLVIDYGLADRIEDMAEIVLRQAPQHFALAGHSMGGRVAQEIVKRAPHRVTRLALLSTDFRGPAQNVSEWASLLQAARDGGMQRAAEVLLPHLIAAERLADEALVSAIEAMIRRHSVDHLAAQLRAGHMRPDYSTLLPTIGCPTLVCTGDRDAIRPVAVHEDMAARIPQSRLVVVPDCGHMVAMEQQDALTEILQMWLLPTETLDGLFRLQGQG